MQVTGGIDHPGANGPRLLLADHHREIQSACLALRARTYEDNPRTLIAQFHLFEDALLEHLRAEEEMILPAYALYDEDDAATIRATHREIRDRLMSLGVAVELHAVKAGDIERFVGMLDEHASHEDALMYPWAQLHLPLRTKRHLYVLIGRSLQRLTRDRLQRAEERMREDFVTGW